MIVYTNHSSIWQLMCPCQLQSRGSIKRLNKVHSFLGKRCFRVFHYYFYDLDQLNVMQNIIWRQAVYFLWLWARLLHVCNYFSCCLQMIVTLRFIHITLSFLLSYFLLLLYTCKGHVWTSGKSQAEDIHLTRN